MLQLKHKAEMARALANNPLVVVKFSAPWCVPCQGYAPIFESTEKKFNGKVTFAEVNVEECDELDSTHNVRSVPTTIVFRDCIEVGRATGALSAIALEQLIVNNMQ